MRWTLSILLFCLIISCTNNDQSFNISDDSIILTTTKSKDVPASNNPYVNMGSKNGGFWDELFPNFSGVSDTMENAIIYYYCINNIQALFQAYLSFLFLN